MDRQRNAGIITFSKFRATSLA